MSEKPKPMCSRCAKNACTPRIKPGEKPSIEAAPPFCPMKLMPEVIENCQPEYDRPEVSEFARLAAVQEGECCKLMDDGYIHTQIPRVEETVQFAKKNGYKRLGIAFCGGLGEEGRILTDILEANGFEVVSVKCKVGAIPKERLGVKPEEKIVGADRWETMCNPIAQAEIINNSGVDLAIMVGLCVGHDTLFLKYCRVPVTVLVVKDRVFGHNPVAGLYLAKSPYYGRLLAKDFPFK